MAIVESVLCLQVGKCFFNFLPFLCLRKVHNQASVISLLILNVTDTMITGFLLCLWIGGWPLSPSTEVVYLRFLAFENNAYETIIFLLPFVCISEKWSRSRVNQCGGGPTTKNILCVQSRLLSLACWLIAASYSQHPLRFLETPPVCEMWDWKCPFMYIREKEHFDWLLPSIGLVLGATLFYSSTGNSHSMASAITDKEQPLDELVISILLVLSAGVNFVLLPSFIAVSSWTFIAIDRLSGLFGCQTPEPLITVSSAVEHMQVKGQTSCIEKAPLIVTSDK